MVLHAIVIDEGAVDEATREEAEMDIEAPANPVDLEIDGTKPGEDIPSDGEARRRRGTAFAGGRKLARWGGKQTEGGVGQ